MTEPTPSELSTAADIAEVEEGLYRLDPTCPRCHEHSGVGEVTDGGGHDCDNCEAPLMAVAYNDGTMLASLAGRTGRPRRKR